MTEYGWIFFAFLGPIVLYLIYSFFEAKYKAKKENELQDLNQQIDDRIQQSSERIEQIEKKLKDLDKNG